MRHLAFLVAVPLVCAGKTSAAASANQIVSGPVCERVAAGESTTCPRG
ncbi:MAG TPA: hypothetical protein VLM85_22545 [Polyangiaceae bacterium]|nr:hypothetical protein [Polyangiaceae bacterium]